MGFDDERMLPLLIGVIVCRGDCTCGVIRFGGMGDDGAGRNPNSSSSFEGNS